MRSFTQTPFGRIASISILCAIALAVTTSSFAGEDGHKTSGFKGVKANTGYAIHMVQNGKDTLMWSDDFTIPEAPAPHWQIVDSKGNTYLLQRLVVKGDKQNRTITVPRFVPDIAKVQIWCAYAEALLGEASFSKAMTMIDFDPTEG